MKMKKLISLFLAVVLCVVSFAGCQSTTTKTGETNSTASQSKSSPLKIMFVVSTTLGGGTNVDDVNKAINDYVAKNGGSAKTFECRSDTSLYQPTLQEAAESGEYDLIITGFSSMVESVCKVANMYPKQKFMVFDANVNFSGGAYPNVLSVRVLQNEGAFLAGVLAALITTSKDVKLANEKKCVGFVGATETTSILDFLVGYIQGVKYVDTSIQVLYSFVGSQTDSALTQELALSQFQSGADVIFGATNSDLEVANMATKNGFYAICVDADEATKLPSSKVETARHILTSVVKDYYNMVFPILEAIGSGTANWGKHTNIPYSEGGVYVADNEYFRAIVPASVMTKYQTIVDALKSSGNIEVKTAYGASTDEINKLKSLSNPY